MTWFIVILIIALKKLQTNNKNINIRTNLTLKDDISLNIAYKGTYTKGYNRILFW